MQQLIHRINTYAQIFSAHLYLLWCRVFAFWQQTHWSIQVLSIFALSRIWGWVIFSVIGAQDKYTPWKTGPMSYAEFISIWDSGWYEKIALDGYPRILPTNSEGIVTQNTWAFYPLYPMSVKFIQELTGSAYYPTAIALATVSGFIASLVVYLLFNRSISWCRQHRLHLNNGSSRAVESPHHLALWATAAFAWAPVAPILQVPYAEALNMVFLGLTLYLMMTQRWALGAIAGILAAFSRPVGVPLGALAGIWWLLCMCRSYHQTPQAHSTVSTLRGVLIKHLGQGVSAISICAAAISWPLIAWAYTGRMDAYTATETAWRQSHLVLFQPWIAQSQEYFGPAGVPVLIMSILGFTFLMASRCARRVLHPVLNLWCYSYLTYLLLFLYPQSSTFRLLLPLFPLLVVFIGMSGSRAYRVLWIVASAIFQSVWVGWLWHWKELPGGGDYPP
ncbi:hypothetical protein ACN08X_00390 [Rothia sp. P6271]|uniref:hypothetical protein n=1 Tax=Rothia sp. P6271 TaxID=3402659 RepID=UPI003AD09F61